MDDQKLDSTIQKMPIEAGSFSERKTKDWTRFITLGALIVGLYTVLVVSINNSCISLGCAVAGIFNLPVLPLYLIPFFGIEFHFNTWSSFSPLKFQYYNLLLLTGLIYGFILCWGIAKINKASFRLTSMSIIIMVVIPFVIVNGLLFFDFSQKTPTEIAVYCNSGSGEHSGIVYENCVKDSLNALALRYNISECKIMRSSFPFSPVSEETDVGCIISNIEKNNFKNFCSGTYGCKAYENLMSQHLVNVADSRSGDDLLQEQIACRLVLSQQTEFPFSDSYNRCLTDITSSLWNFIPLFPDKTRSSVGVITVGFQEDRLPNTFFFTYWENLNDYKNPSRYMVYVYQSSINNESSRLNQDILQGNIKVGDKIPHKLSFESSTDSLSMKEIISKNIEGIKVVTAKISVRDSISRTEYENHYKLFNIGNVSFAVYFDHRQVNSDKIDIKIREMINDLRPITDLK